MTSSLNDLNPAQRQAVTVTNSHTLVIAGAGCGKTKTLISRVAYLLDHEMIPETEILALTFTNKAAKEMKERLGDMTRRQLKNLWMGTFHGYCLSFLKKNSTKIGLDQNFLIYDSGDQLVVIKEVCEQIGVDLLGLIKPKEIQGIISKSKNECKTPEDFLCEKDNLFSLSIGQVFQRYQEYLELRGALDFDDLLRRTLDALKRLGDEIKPEFKHILIDEYQDTNTVQYEIIRRLTQSYTKIFAVGDDDQSIYAWRGANVKNMMNFTKDYPNVRLIELTHNYRSTNEILQLANGIIAKNTTRFKKELFSTKTFGERPLCYFAEDEVDEEKTYLAKLRSLKNSLDLKWSDVAFIFRTAFRSRSVESVLRLENIPYKVIGGTGFFEREEVKNCLAYMRLVYNQNDDLSFYRISNFPARGIGEESIKKLNDIKLQNKEGIFFSIDHLTEGLRPSQLQALQAFKNNILTAKNEIAEGKPMSAVFTALFERIGIEGAITSKASTEAIAQFKLGNFNELLNYLHNFEKKNPQNPLSNFLQYVQLFEIVSNNEEDDNKVQLLTAHAAKGLEFECVFLVNADDTNFPNQKALEENSLEEERRLFYVAVTRAKRQLFISFSKFRMMYGKRKPANVTRFLDDLAPELYQSKNDGKKQNDKDSDWKTEREKFFNQFNI